MNIKAYLDYFDEISDLPRDEQFTLLEEAHNLVKGEGVVSKFSVVSFLAPVLSLVLLIGAGTLIFGRSILVMVICFVFALLISRVMVSELHTSFMSTGLKRVMADKRTEDS